MDPVRIAVALVACVGAAISLAFLGAAHRWWPADASWILRVCRLGEETCARVVDTRWGRVLWVPNAWPGVAWFLALGAWAVGWLPVPATAIIVGATAALVSSLVLAWALLYRLRTPCTLCMAAHGVNLLVAALLAWIASRGPA